MVYIDVFKLTSRLFLGAYLYGMIYTDSILTVKWQYTFIIKAEVFAALCKHIRFYKT
jgi:hypothetical protein